MPWLPRIYRISKTFIFAGFNSFKSGLGFPFGLPTVSIYSIFRARVIPTKVTCAPGSYCPQSLLENLYLYDMEKFHHQEEAKSLDQTTKP